MSWNKQDLDDDNKYTNLSEEKQFEKFLSSNTSLSISINNKKQGIQLDIKGDIRDVSMMICLAMKANSTVRAILDAAVGAYNKENLPKTKK